MGLGAGPFRGVVDPGELGPSSSEKTDEHGGAKARKEVSALEREGGEELVWSLWGPEREEQAVSFRRTSCR